MQIYPIYKLLIIFWIILEFLETLFVNQKHLLLEFDQNIQFLETLKDAECVHKVLTEERLFPKLESQQLERLLNE